MPERVRQHAILSGSFTLVSILLTEIASHFLHLDPTLTAGLFLLGLVPVAYGALGAGLWSGLANSAALTIYVMHYSGPHEVALSLDSWPAALIVLGLGFAMSYPMGIVHDREVRFRREIKQHTASLERKNEELVEVNAALESFGYVVSHDLKEPVRAIENYLAAAREEWGTEESKRFVVEAHAANARLARMLQGLLEYSRTSSLPATPRPMSISEALQSDLCRGRFERLYEERGVRLEVELGLPRVTGDEVLLCQVFGNLLLNAASHNHAEKPVVRILRGPSRDGRAHFIVSDNGPGFPPEVIARFDRLPRRGPATVKTGFGLIIAQRALRRLDGELWIDNAPEGGARAHVELPAA